MENKNGEIEEKIEGKTEEKIEEIAEENIKNSENTGNEKGSGESEREYIYWLTQISGLGAVKIKKLAEYAGDFEAIYNMKKEQFKKLLFLSEKDCLAIEGEKKMLPSRREAYHRLGESGIEFITIHDKGYPERLKRIYDPPIALFVKGQLPADEIPSAALIGARSCSYYGRCEAEHIGKILAESGIQVVSGLAYGIDGAGHKGVLSADGAAYAVLGSGIDNCYPRENWGLYNSIPKRGGVISEYGPGCEAKTWHFPVRNRIISGLSDVVVVVEARKRSGSLITVGLALEQGKEVFAVPGRVTDPLSMGCNELIRAGASLLLSPEDVLEFLGIKWRKKIKVEKKLAIGLAKNEKKVYSCLDSHPKHVDSIAVTCGLPVNECMAVLLGLELGGYAVQATNQYYVKKSE